MSFFVLVEIGRGGVFNHFNGREIEVGTYECFGAARDAAVLYACEKATLFDKDLRANPYDASIDLSLGDIIILEYAFGGSSAAVSHSILRTTTDFSVTLEIKE